MLNKIIEGRYQTTTYFKKSKYTKTRYRSVYVIKDANGEIVKFEGNYFSEIRGAVEDVVRYLKRNNIKGEYDLIFNNSKLLLSADCDFESIIQDYLVAYRHTIFEDCESDF